MLHATRRGESIINKREVMGAEQEKRAEEIEKIEESGLSGAGGGREREAQIFTDRSETHSSK